MAGDWIKIEMATPDKPEVDQISAILGIDPDAVVGKLLRFWIWADIQSVNGHGLSVTKKLIDRITYCDGFADALLKVDWLQARSGSFAIPRFDRHNGKSAKNRAEATERKRLSRKTRDNGHEKSVTEARPEKRREELVTEVTNKKDKCAPAQPLPHGPEFEKVWAQWVKHRSEIRKPLKPTMIAAQLEDLGRIGEEHAVTRIRHTIAMGWQGLRDPEPTNGHQANPAIKRDDIGGRTMSIVKVSDLPKTERTEDDDYFDSIPL